MGLNLEVVSENNKFDIIVVGAGISGLCCTNYLSNLKTRTCLMDANMPGGKIKELEIVTDFPGSKAIKTRTLIDTLFSQAIQKDKAKYSHGNVQIIKKQENNKFYLYTDDGTAWEAKSIIIATGAPNSTSFLPVELELDSKSLIVVNKFNLSNLNGLYAIGACCNDQNIALSNILHQAQLVAKDSFDYVIKNFKIDEK